MGSDSDLPILQKTIDTLKSFGVPYEVHVYSAHRTPVEASEFSKNARANGFGVIIAAAGMAAHLAGALAANTTLPIIGIPVNSGSLGGIDADDDVDLVKESCSFFNNIQMTVGKGVKGAGINSNFHIFRINPYGIR